MATIYGSTSSSYWTHKLEVTENSYDIATNTSSVTVDVYIGRTNSASYFRGTSTTTITISGVGSQEFSKSWSSNQNVSAWGYYYIGSASFTVPHNADGSKVINVSSSMSNGFSPNTASANGDVTLTTIPRYASITKFTLATVNETSINFTWDADANCDSVQYSLNGGGWTNGIYPTTTISGLSANTQYSVKIRVKRADSQLWTESGIGYVTTYDYPKAESVGDFVIGTGPSITLYNPLRRNVTFTINQKTTNTVLGTYTGTYHGVVNAEFITDSAVKSQYNSITGSSGTYYAKVVCSDTGTTKTSGYYTYSVNIGLYKPTLTATVKDYNPVTYALTNDRDILIPYKSIARITPTVTSLGDSRDTNVSFKEYRLFNTVFTTDYIDTECKEAQAFAVAVTNSRDITSNYIYVSPLNGTIPYFNPTITNCEFKRNSQTGQKMFVSANGTFFNDYFDSQETNHNNIYLKYYVRKSEEDDWTLGGNVDLTNLSTSDNTYSLYETEISNPFTEEGYSTGEWDYMTKYYIRLEACDILATGIYYDEYVTKGIPYYEWWAEDGVNYFNVNGEIMENGVFAFLDNYSQTTKGGYSRKYINDNMLLLKSVNGLSLSHGASLTDYLLQTCGKQITFYYKMNDNGYRHSMTIQKGDNEWAFDVYSNYTMYVRVNWNTGQILTSQYDSNSVIIGYDLLYTRGG